MLVILLLAGCMSALPVLAGNAGAAGEQIEQMKERQQALLRKMAALAVDLDAGLAALSGKTKTETFYQRINQYAAQDEHFGGMLEEYRLLDEEIDELQQLSEVSPHALKYLLRKMASMAEGLDAEMAALTGQKKVETFYGRIERYAAEDEAFREVLDQYRQMKEQLEQDATAHAADEGGAAPVAEDSRYPMPDVKKLGVPEFPASIREKKWSWDRIHRYIALHKRGDYTEEEIKTIAGLDMIQLGSGSGSQHMAKRLKKYNPNMICIGYRNSIIWHETFDSDLFREHPDWFLKNPRTGMYETHGKSGLKAKKPLFDFRKPEVRKWWIEDIGRQCDSEELDGVLIDAFAKVLTDWGPKRRALSSDPKQARAYNEIFTEKVLLENIRVNGSKGLIIANALRSGYKDCLKSFVDVYTHGSYMEWIEGRQATYEEGLSHLIDTLIQIGKEPGVKVLCFQFHAGYPPPPKTDAGMADFRIGGDSDIMPDMGEEYDAKGKTEEQILKEMQAAFPYKLAIFLICANEYSYMGYQSTMLANDGDRRWAPHYPEHEKKIGRPLGHAVKKGQYYYERQFEHVSVKLNVQTREAHLDWK